MHVAPRAAAEIENPAALEHLGQDQPASVVARADFFVYCRERVRGVPRRRLQRATRAGLEIAGLGQNLTVILFDEVQHVQAPRVESTALS
jgi:hypothetical protein